MCSIELQYNFFLNQLIGFCNVYCLSSSIILLLLIIKREKNVPFQCVKIIILFVQSFQSSHFSSVVLSAFVLRENVVCITLYVYSCRTSIHTHIRLVTVFILFSIYVFCANFIFFYCLRFWCLKYLLRYLLYYVICIVCLFLHISIYILALV